MKKFLSIVLAYLVALPVLASPVSTAIIAGGIMAAKTALLAILAALLGLSAAALGVVMVYRFLHRLQVAVETESNDDQTIDVEAHEVGGGYDAPEEWLAPDLVLAASEDGDFQLECSHCGQIWNAGELVDEGTYVSGGWFWGCPGCHEYNDQE